IVTGSAALVLADRTSWPAVYIMLAGLMAAVMLVSTRAPEPSAAAPPGTLKEAVGMPFVDFFSRSGAGRGGLVLGFLVLFRLGAGGILDELVQSAFFGNSIRSAVERDGRRPGPAGRTRGRAGGADRLAGLLLDQFRRRVSRAVVSARGCAVEGREKSPALCPG